MYINISHKLCLSIGNQDTTTISLFLENPKIKIEKYHCLMAIEDHIEEQLLARLIERYLSQAYANIKKLCS